MDSGDSLSEEYLKSITSELHTNIQDEIQVLFYIHERLKGIPQALPHYRLGKVFFARNFLEEAVEQFQKTIEYQPDFIRAYKHLGLSYLKLRAYNMAAETFERAIELQPEFPDILDCLGVVYTHLSNYEKAKNHLQRAINIKANAPESNFNLGVVLFLSTLGDDALEENIVLPVRVQRALKHIRELEKYQDTYWQQQFDRFFEILGVGKKKDIIDALFDIQLQITTRDDISTTMDYFFLKFMFGGRELDIEEMEYYESKIRDEAAKHNGFADYWNELGVIHLIQCRDYFLKAMNEVGKAVEINPKYESALNTLDLMKHSKKGFLILLRAILK